ncbi:MAG TPA: hypothetical protein VIH45_07055 [Desulfuromonadaceae bacterium]
MKWREWLEKWDMASLKIKTPFLDMEWHPKDADKDAAWELYIELLTRITTQPLPKEFGDEETALNSVYQLFPLTREIIKKHGRLCFEFTKLAVVVLNQLIRPFTAKWHKAKIYGDLLLEHEACMDFRAELVELQDKLRRYTKMLADMAGVEDLTEMEYIAQ